MSAVLMLMSFPASMNFSCWSFLSKRMRSLLFSRSSKSLMTALFTVPPFVPKVSSTFEFLRTIGASVPLSALWNRAEVSFKASFILSFSFSFSDFALSASSFSAFSLFTCAIESCIICCLICSSDGRFHQLNPMNTSAMSTNPMIVFLSISLFCFFFFVIISRLHSTKLNFAIQSAKVQIFSNMTKLKHMFWQNNFPLPGKEIVDSNIF